MHELEKRALSDPFLADAMDGFETHPRLPENFVKKHEYRNYSTMKTILIGGGILIAMFAFVLILNRNYKSGKVELADITDTSAIMIEVEILPESIDTLVVADQPELITAQEISQSTSRYQPIDKAGIDDSDIDSIVVVDRDLDDPENEFRIEDEAGVDINSNGAPTTFMYDMLCVDYRYIEREKDNIRYTKYELGGISAEFENDAMRNSTDLVEKEVDVPYTEYLEKSMEFFASADYKKALSRYLVILDQYPTDINAIFFGGLAYYNLKQYDKALELFVKIETHTLNAFREEACWYRAKTLVKIGKNVEAKSVLDKIISGGGFYTKDAILFRKNLK